MQKKKKAFDKIQHPFMIKILTKVSIEEIYLNKKVPTANKIINSEVLKTFQLKYGARQGCPFSPLLFNIESEVLATAIRQEKRKTRYPDWKGRGKTVITLR